MTKFRLNDKLNPRNYKNCQEIKNISKWQAKIISGNSMSDDKEIGEFDDVGYVWVSLVDNSIIPIARSDEHHRGYDCIVEDLKLNVSEYYPVYLGGDYYKGAKNNQYPYNETDAKELKIALLKLQYYGRDLTTIDVNMSYITNNFNSKSISAKEFIEGKYGQEKYENNNLTKLGEKLVKTLEKLSSTYTYIIEHQMSSDKLFNVVNELFDVCQDIKLDSRDKIFNNVMLDNIYEAMQQYDSGKGSRYLESALFYFGGIRNIIHNVLRKNIDNANLNKQLGNVANIVEMISNI